ncbi:MAG: hypothetical protein WC043_00835 [Pseudobdellovibrionaceae bacterium]
MIKRFGLMAVVIGMGAVIAALPASAAEKGGNAEKILCSKTADYVAGVDVNGNPVAPADLPTRLSDDSNPLVLPLTLDLAQRLTGAQVPEGAKMDAVMGEIKIHKDGVVEFDGQNITQRVAEFCGAVPVGQYQTLKPAAEPVAGSVVMSTTGPQPEVKYEIQRETVNMSR